MLSASACTGRRTVVFLFAASGVFLVALFLFSESFSRVSWDYAQKVQDHWGSVVGYVQHVPFILGPG